MSSRGWGGKGEQNQDSWVLCPALRKESSPIAKAGWTGEPGHLGSIPGSDADSHQPRASLRLRVPWLPHL